MSPRLIFIICFGIMSLEGAADTAFAFKLGEVSRNLNALKSSISENDCPQTYNLHHFGHRQDQDGLGLCWAYAGAALLEEQRCLSDESLCGESISPLDASRCTWTLEKYFAFGFGHESEGGYPNDAVKCGLENGVCNEDLVPTAVHSAYACGYLAQILLSSTPFQCLMQQLSQVYSVLHSSIMCLPGAQTLLQRNLSEVRQALNPILRGDRSADDLEKLAAKSPSGSDFVKKALLGPECDQHRTAVDPGRKFDAFHSGEGVKPLDRWHQLTEAMRSGRSAAIGVCLDSLDSRSLGISPILVKATQIFGALDSPINRNPLGSAIGCAGHAVVVDGMKWNRYSRKCEIHIRNSWGASNKSFEGWMPAAPVIAATMDLSFIRAKK